MKWPSSNPSVVPVRRGRYTRDASAEERPSEDTVRTQASASQGEKPGESGLDHAGSLILDFQPLTLRSHQVLLFKPPGLWWCVAAARADRATCRRPLRAPSKKQLLQPGSSLQVRQPQPPPSLRSHKRPQSRTTQMYCSQIPDPWKRHEINICVGLNW